MTEPTKPTTAETKTSCATCSSCTYFRSGLCARRAPQGFGRDAGWPGTSADSWCGEHSDLDGAGAIVDAIGGLTDAIRTFDLTPALDSLCGSIGSAGRTVAAAFRELAEARRRAA